jgi:hypothetical protein
MVHLGFPAFVAAAYIECRFEPDTIRLTRHDQPPAQPCKFSSDRNRFRFRSVISSSRAQISSRSSQKAAALLLDPVAVGIR